MKIATLYIDGKAIDLDMEVLPSEFMLISEKCRKQAESEKVKVGDKIAIPFGISPQRTIFLTVDKIEEKVPHTAPMKKCERNIHCDYCPECWNKCPMCN